MNILFNVLSIQLDTVIKSLLSAGYNIELVSTPAEAARKIKVNHYDYIFPTFNDGAIQILAAINDTYNLIGIKSTTADLIKTKTSYYDIFEKLSIPCPKNYAFFENKTLLVKYLEEHSINKTLLYPCIVKPYNSSGSCGVVILSNNKDLSYVFDNQNMCLINSGYILQQYIAGTICSVVGRIVRSKIYIDLLYDIETDCYPHAAETGFYYPSLYHTKIEAALKEYLTSFFDYIGLNDSPFTLDCIVSDNIPYFIDFGARLSINAQILLNYGGELNYGNKLVANIINHAPIDLNLRGSVLFRQIKLPKYHTDIVCTKANLAAEFTLGINTSRITNDLAVMTNPRAIFVADTIEENEHNYRELVSSIII